MGICSSNSNLKRFLRCSKCQSRQQQQKHLEQSHQKYQKHKEEPFHSDQVDRQIMQTFYALADDPAYISRMRFEESFGHALGPALWHYLQGEGNEEMKLEEFVQHGQNLKTMRINSYAQIGMCPYTLIKAALESSGIETTSSTEIEFLHHLSSQMKNGPEEIIAWKDTHCPRLFQSIHEHVMNKFLGIPKSIVEESKLEESGLLEKAQLFFLKHNLPRAVFFESAESVKNEGKKTDGNVPNGGGWTKLYSAKSAEGLNATAFQENVFNFDGSTVAIFQMNSGELLVLAVDEQWKNNPRPFGGPYTILFKFHPEFQRIEVNPPALHCNFGDPNWANAIFFNGGSILAVQRDFSNFKSVEVWACARTRNTQIIVPEIGEEELEILEKRRPKKVAQQREGGGKKGRKLRSANEEWAQNPDKQLLEMAGFTFADNRRRGGNKPPPEPQRE